MAEFACYYSSFLTVYGSDDENWFVQNDKDGKLMKMLNFKLRTSSPLDTRAATLQSLRVRNM